MVLKMKRFQVLYPQVLRNDVGYIRIVILKKMVSRKKEQKIFCIWKQLVPYQLLIHVRQTTMMAKARYLYVDYKYRWIINFSINFKFIG